MTVIVLVLFALCLVQVRMADRGTLYSDYLAKEHTTAVSGIFVILVFLRHFYGHTTVNGAFDSFAYQLNGKLGQLLVTAFLFYSGFGVMNAIAAKGSGYTAKLPQKSVRILIHFHMALALYLVMQLCFGTRLPLKTILLSMVCWVSIGNSNWYIFAILCLYLLTWLSFTVFRKDLKAGALFLVVLSVMLILLLRIFRPAFCYDTILCYPLGAWYFLLHRRVSEYRLQRPADKAKHTIALYLAALTALLALFWLCGRYAGANEWIDMARNCVFVLLVVFITMKIRLNNAFLSFLGEHVFSIYILQRLPLIVCKKLGLLDRSPYVCFIAAFLITLLIAIPFDRMTAAFDRAVFREGRNRKTPSSEPAPVAQQPVRRELLVLSILSCLIVGALVISLRLTAYRRTVTVTATDEKNAQSQNTQLYLKDISYDSKTGKVPAPAQGSWVWYNNLYCWFPWEDERAKPDMTDSIVLQLPLKQNTSLRFIGNCWKGMVRVSEGEWETTADTFSAKEDGELVAVTLPEPTLRQVVRSFSVPGVLLAVLLFAGYGLLELPRLIRNRKTRG